MLVMSEGVVDVARTKSSWCWQRAIATTLLLLMMMTITMMTVVVVNGLLMVVSDGSGHCRSGDAVPVVRRVVEVRNKWRRTSRYSCRHSGIWLASVTAGPRRAHSCTTRSARCRHSCTSSANQHTHGHIRSCFCNTRGLGTRWLLVGTVGTSIARSKGMCKSPQH